MKKIFIAVLASMMLLAGCGNNATSVIDSDIGVRYALNGVQKEAEEEISANDAIMIISMKLTPEKKYNLMENAVVYYVDGREAVQDKMCYIIRFGKGTEKEFETENTYAVAVDGKTVFEKQSDGSWSEVAIQG